MTDKITMTLLVNTAVFSVMFCVMLLLRKAAGKKISPVLMLVMWAAVLIKLVIPFGFESNLSILPTTPAAGHGPYEYIQAADGKPDAYGETGNAAPAGHSVNAAVQPERNIRAESAEAGPAAPANGIDWAAAALCVWGLGAVIVSAGLCLSAANLKKRIKYARIDTPKYIIELLAQCRTESGINRNIPITVQSALDKPVIMGALRPVLVLPEDAGRLGRETLRHVLLHELTHFKGGDLWAIKLMNVLRAVYWFNPLIWICFKLIREDIEIACDQRVIKSLGQRHRLSYIETVLSFAGRKSPDRLAAAMGLFDGRPTMERRIKSMYGKTKTGIKGRIIAGLAAALIFAVSALTACQPAAAVSVMNKNRTQSRWEYSKEYGSGRSLNVDAAVYSLDSESLPTLTVIPKAFENGEKIKSITNLFCPNAKVYAQLQGDDVQLDITLSANQLREASYQFVKFEDGSTQVNMIAESGDSISYIDFVNWDNNYEKLDSSKGSAFYFESDSFNYENSETRDKLVTPESLSGDGDFVKAKETADECVKGMGIDYMALNSVSRGEGSYSFYYTREYEGLPETYVQSHTGTSVTGVDGAPVISLWNAEYLYIVIQNDNVVKARWENPSEIKGVENGKIKILPWEQIKQIFRNAMDDMMTLTPYEKAAGTNAYARPEGTKVIINRVELGYTKLHTQGIQDDYRLIPTWTFMGYEIWPSSTVKEGVNTGAGTCFVTINAIDGTVIDRGQGL